ncbi:MAG: hypothetical protein Q9187_004163 [Circinaria calcarea]
MAAAAAIQTILPSKLLGSNAPRRSVSHSSEEKQNPKQKEKRFIANFKDSNGSSLPTEKIAEDPKHKQLGHPSRHLQLKDFDLLKTIGTGTFARVWLARLASPSKEDRDKVFALKIIRKVDIIRLKQVEHVRNERNTLAAVAGHPFITTLITTFSDKECLYMLVYAGPPMLG